MLYLDVLKNGYKKSFTIEGRASRSEFWLFQLHVPVILYICMFLDPMGDSGGVLVFFLSVLGSIPAEFSLIIRRLHDVGYSGWVFLLLLIPFIGQFYALILLLRPSEEENKYGPEPITYEIQNNITYEIENGSTLTKEKVGVDENTNRANIGDNALLLPIAMAIGLILIFAGGFSQANVSMALESCGDIPQFGTESDTDDYHDCLKDARTKSENATRMSTLGFVISLLVIYLRISRIDI